VKDEEIEEINVLYKKINDATDLLKEARSFIDDIIPACPAGFDQLSSLKWRIDQYIKEKTK
jgi:hypothetical protein